MLSLPPERIGNQVCLGDTGFDSHLNDKYIYLIKRVRGLYGKISARKREVLALRNELLQRGPYCQDLRADMTVQTRLIRYLLYG